MSRLVEVENGATYSSADALRLTGLSRADLEVLAEAGLVRPGETRQHFDFRDLVIMRTSRRLREAGLPRSRVRRALEKLQGQVAELTTIRVWSDGRNILAQQGADRWQPESGQRLLNFDAPTPPAQPVPMRQPVSQASEWFTRACDLETVSSDESIEAYRKTLRMEPDHQEAHVNLGRILHEKGNLEAAEAHYRSAVALSPADPICFYNLGVVLQDQKRDGEALDAYERAIAVDPQFKDAHFNLAHVYERSGKRLSALRHLSLYRRLSR